MNDLFRNGRGINDPKLEIELHSTNSSERWSLTDSSASNWICESVSSPKFKLPLSVWSTTSIYIRCLNTKLAFKQQIYYQVQHYKALYFTHTLYFCFPQDSHHKGELFFPPIQCELICLCIRRTLCVLCDVRIYLLVQHRLILVLKGWTVHMLDITAQICGTNMTT